MRFYSEPMNRGMRQRLLRAQVAVAVAVEPQPESNLTATA